MKQRTFNINNIDVLGVLLLLFFCAYYGHARLYINFFNVIIDLRPLSFIFLIGFTILCFITDLLKKRFNIKHYTFFLWYTIFFLYCTLSLAWTLDFNTTIEVLIKMLTSVSVLFVVVFYVNSEEKFYRIIKIQLFSFCYMALRVVILLPERHFFGRGRVLLYIQEIAGIHYNQLSFFLTLGIIMTAFLYMKTKSRLAFILIPFFYYVILLGGSRTGMIVPIAGLFVMYALAKGIKQVHKIIIALAVIIILFLLYVNSNLPGADRISSLLNGFFNETSEVSFNERAMFRELAASMFVQKPIFGWGISSFTIYLLNINYRTHIFFYSSHNTYLEILACLGIVGFIIYYSMYLRILFRAFKNSVSKNVNIVFSLVVCFTLLMLEYGEVLFYTARGFTSATILFYAFYALKIYPEESKI